MVTSPPSIRSTVFKLGLQTIALGSAAGLGVGYTAIAAAKLNQKKYDFLPAVLRPKKDEFVPSAPRQKDRPEVHFGMYKKRLEEAERRKDRVFADADATPAHRKEALDHYEETLKLSKNAEKVANKNERYARGGVAVAGGAAGVAITTLSGGTVDPIIASEKARHAINTAGGIAGSALTATYGKDLCKIFGDQRADRHDVKHGVRYPSRTVKGVLEDLANGKTDLKQGDHFYDHKGRKWVFNAPPEEVQDLKTKAAEIPRWQGILERVKRELKASPNDFRKENDVEVATDGVTAENGKKYTLRVQAQ